MNTRIENIAAWLSCFSSTMASLVKVMIMSRSTYKRTAIDRDRSVVVLGNGPSLNTTISEHHDFLMSHRRLAVNFAANAPVYFDLRPTEYVLADPHFFKAIETDSNVARLWQNISQTEWEMTLFLPKGAICPAPILANKYITVKRYNLTPVEGITSVSHLLYDKGCGMPRPRNVLIPSIMLAIREGYGQIYIAGADHSWTRTLWVDNQNRVVSIQPHFYEDNDAEKERVATEYHNYPLYKILQSLYVAFRSYFDIAKYAESRGVKIFNITPDSFIDAFPRMKL